MVALKRVGALTLIALIGIGVLGARAVWNIQNVAAVIPAVTITLGVPFYAQDILNERVLADFKAANPGIGVQIVVADTVSQPAAAKDTAHHLDAIQKLVSTADVILFDSADSRGVITPEATHAGYYLNLSPFLEGDSQLNATDFNPALFRAFQWDGGTWALPLAADATVLLYDSVAFDRANLSYPTNAWTIDDLSRAAKALTANGSEIAFRGDDDLALYASLIGKPLFDPDVLPNPPQIDQPEVRTVLDKLAALQRLQSGVKVDAESAALRIGSIGGLIFAPPEAKGPSRRAALLPGGHALLNVRGVAVSGATQNTEASYTLARFLTLRPELTQFGVMSARRSTIIKQDEGFGRSHPKIPQEVAQLLTDALATGLTATDLRFYDYLVAATAKQNTDSFDPRAAIVAAQEDALKAQQIALDRHGDSSKVAVVATSVPTIDPKRGSTLKFGLTVFATSLPQKAAIQALADQFVARTPGLAHIEILGGFDPFESATRKYDCFYLPYSAVPSAALDSILNLDPFMSADKNLNLADFIGGALAATTRDNKVWSLPIGITPTVMWYDSAAFANARIPTPTFGWDISAFKDALKALKLVVKADQAPFIMPGPGGEGISLLMLVAAYGGLPIDWTTTPPTVKFTDPANVAAIRQVLDLAKSGLVDYRSLGRDFGMTIAANQPGSPLYSDQLNGVNFGRLFGAGKDPINPVETGKFAAVTFPRGAGVQALSYSTGTLYISAKAQNPDACYGWISTLAAHPDLLSLMPARQSQLADPNLPSLYGDSLAAVYREVSKVIDDPATLKVPSLFDGGSNISGFVVEYWLFQAWDSYVLKDADLDAALSDAQTHAGAYTTCTAGLPAYDPASQKYPDYLRGLIGCAAKADGRIKALLGN